MIVIRQPMDVGTLVDLVNGWGSEPRRQADEQSLPYPVPQTLSDGVDRPELLAAPAIERQLRRLADALYPIFATAETSERVRLVNDLLRRSGVRPALETAGGRAREMWVVERERDALGAAAAVCLREQLAAAHPDRLGTCAGRRCGDVYVDTSPGGHRRYCSITCQNRNRVAAFRRRQAAAKSVAQQPG